MTQVWDTIYLTPLITIKALYICVFVWYQWLLARSSEVFLDCAVCRSKHSKARRLFHFFSQVVILDKCKISTIQKQHYSPSHIQRQAYKTGHSPRESCGKERDQTSASSPPVNLHSSVAQGSTPGENNSGIFLQFAHMYLFCICVCIFTQNHFFNKFGLYFKFRIKMRNHTLFAWQLN